MEDTPPELSSLLPPSNGNGIRVDYGSSADSLDGNRFHSIHNDASSRLHYSLSASLRKIQDSLAPFRASVRASVRDMGGTSTMSNEMFNLTKNLVGAGALGMPSGFAALAGASRSKWAMLPAGAIILVMGASFAYYFILIGRLCRMLDAASYGEAWQKSAGRRGGVWKAITLLVQLSVIGMAGLGSVAYSIIIPDATTSLLERVGYGVQRNTCLLVVTIFVLLPLCMVKKLSVLAPFSAVGTAGILFTLVVMGWRCFDGSYDAEQGGRLAQSTQTEMHPLFETDEPVVPALSDLFLLLCMCFQAFFSHYNAARFYQELERNTIERYSCVTKVAFGVSGALYFVMGAFGYYTFGAHADGNILNVSKSETHFSCLVFCCCLPSHLTFCAELLCRRRLDIDLSVSLCGCTRIYVSAAFHWRKGRCIGSLFRERRNAIKSQSGPTQCGSLVYGDGTGMALS